MNILTWDRLFGSPATTQAANRKLRTLDKAEWLLTRDDTHFNGITYAAGSWYKFFETKNFGWVVFRGDSKTPEGTTPGRFIHKF